MMHDHTLQYLALGDSYSIGEGLPLRENFPYQLCQLFRQNGYEMAAPEILAQTGWTSAELLHVCIESPYQFIGAYDFVTLCIGVNDQYRGLTPAAFSDSLEAIVQLATSLTYSAENVWVLSIPDWGQSPFASDRNREQIALEIDTFNAIKRKMSRAYGCSYLDITGMCRNQFVEAAHFSADGLHPSSIVYAKWANLLYRQMVKRIV
jgi:lysophospholipase L1-like esterase